MPAGPKAPTPYPKSKLGDKSASMKIPSNSAPSVPPPSSTTSADASVNTSPAGGAPSSSATDAAEVISPDQKAITARKQSIKISRAFIDAIKDDEPEAAVTHRAELEAKIVRQDEELDKIVPALTRLHCKKEGLAKTGNASK